MLCWWSTTCCSSGLGAEMKPILMPDDSNLDSESQRITRRSADSEKSDGSRSENCRK